MSAFKVFTRDQTTSSKIVGILFYRCTVCFDPILSSLYGVMQAMYYINGKTVIVDGKIYLPNFCIYSANALFRYYYCLSNRIILQAYFLQLFDQVEFFISLLHVNILFRVACIRSVCFGFGPKSRVKWPSKNSTRCVASVCCVSLMDSMNEMK